MAFTLAYLLRVAPVFLTPGYGQDWQSTWPSGLEPPYRRKEFIFLVFSNGKVCMFIEMRLDRVKIGNL